MKDLLAVLNCRDPPAGETLAVAAAIDEIDDGRLEVAALEKVRVQRMHRTTFIDRPIGRLQSLPEHLAAKYLRAADIATLAPKTDDLEPLKIEQPHQAGEALIHQAAATPRRFCMAGLVVVYCRNCFLAGYR